MNSGDSDTAVGQQLVAMDGIPLADHNTSQTSASASSSTQPAPRAPSPSSPPNPQLPVPAPAPPKSTSTTASATAAGSGGHHDHFHSPRQLQTSPIPSRARPWRRSYDGTTSLPSLDHLDGGSGSPLNSNSNANSSWIWIRKSQLTPVVGSGGGGGRNGRNGRRHRQMDTASESNVPPRLSVDSESTRSEVGDIDGTNRKTESPLRSSSRRKFSRQSQKESGLSLGPDGEGHHSSNTTNNTGRRATSPFRFIHQFSSTLHGHSHGHRQPFRQPQFFVEEEEPFIPIDPFKWSPHFHNNLNFTFPNLNPFRFRPSKVGNGGVGEPSEGLPSHHTVTSADYDFNCTCLPSFLFSTSKIGTTSSSASGPPPQIPVPNAPIPHAQALTQPHGLHPHLGLNPHPFTPLQTLRIFTLDTLPRQLYINLLLRLPAMYFSRVAKIFQDAEVSKPDIQRMIEASCGNVGGGGTGGGLSYLIPTPEEAGVASVGAVGRGGGGVGVGVGVGARVARGAGGYDDAAQPGFVQFPTPFGPAGSALPPGPTFIPGPGIQYPPSQPTPPPPQPFIQIPPQPQPDPSAPLPSPDEWTPPYVSPALIRFKHSWEVFIDSLMREWKTLNVVSALLLSAILTMFQVPDAASDPITRTAALLSLVCATMSLSYGCMYILRFGTMRSMVRASRWAEEAAKTKTSIWWNVWVFLAMPVVWIAWSMIFFVISLLSFVWRTGSSSDPPQRNPLPPSGALATRIMITLVFGLGLAYFVLIVVTLRRYGQSTRGRGMRRSKMLMSEEGQGDVVMVGGGGGGGGGGGVAGEQSQPRPLFGPLVPGLPSTSTTSSAVPLLSVDTASVTATTGPSGAPRGVESPEYAMAMERRGRGREPRYPLGTSGTHDVGFDLHHPHSHAHGLAAAAPTGGGGGGSGRRGGGLDEKGDVPMGGAIPIPAASSVVSTTGTGGTTSMSTVTSTPSPVVAMDRDAGGFAPVWNAPLAAGVSSVVPAHQQPEGTGSWNMNSSKDPQHMHQWQRRLYDHGYPLSDSETAGTGRSNSNSASARTVVGYGGDGFGFGEKGEGLKL